MYGPRVTVIEYKNLRFLIMDAPSDSNLYIYLHSMKEYNVVELVRVCVPTYDKSSVEKYNIHVHEWLFEDGAEPPKDIINKWLDLVEHTFQGKEKPDVSIAIHCVAGLGRAPVLVAIALIEFTGMSSLEAVQFIRAKRKGAINKRQLDFLTSYKKRVKSRRKSKECCIM